MADENMRWPETCAHRVVDLDGVCADSETWRTVGPRCAARVGRPRGAGCAEVERARCAGAEVERVTLVDDVRVGPVESLPEEPPPRRRVHRRAALWRVFKRAVEKAFSDCGKRRVETTGRDSEWETVEVEGVTVEVRAIAFINFGVGRPIIPKLAVRGTLAGRAFYVSGDDAHGYNLYAALAAEAEARRVPGVPLVELDGFVNDRKGG